jgi:hypothetical protein
VIPSRTIEGEEDKMLPEQRVERSGSPREEAWMARRVRAAGGGLVVAGYA